MKYRGSGKIKRQHGTIKGLIGLLRKIEAWDEVQGIVPGRIEPANTKGNLHLRISYETNSGLKGIARGHSAVQEVFFVTSNPAALKKRLEEEGLI